MSSLDFAGLPPNIMHDIIFLTGCLISPIISVLPPFDSPVLRPHLKIEIIAGIIIIINIWISTVNFLCLCYCIGPTMIDHNSIVSPMRRYSTSFS